MGINGLWQTISKKHPEVLKSVYRRSFRGRRIAVDSNYWFFVLRAAVRSRVIYNTDVINNGVDEDLVDKLWIEDIYKHLHNWLSLGITPILVYDGPSPVKKTGTKIKRTQDKERVLKRIEELNSVSITDGSQIDFVKLQELGITDLAEFDTQKLMEMRKLLSQLSYIPANSLNKVKTFFQKLGFPTLTAIGDGERLAAAICARGIATAAYSADGDSLVHGCPILIKGPGVDTRDAQGIATQTFEIVYLEDVLRALDVNFRQFVDICITAGCDYNINMPKKAIAAAITLVKKYDSIDNFPRDQYDITCLDHIDCRELFQQVPMESLILEASIPEIPVMTPDELSTMLGMTLNFSEDAFKPVPTGTMFDMAPIQHDMIESYFLSMENHFALYEMQAYLNQYFNALKLLKPPENFYHTALCPELCPDMLENVSILTKTKSQRRGRKFAKFLYKKLEESSFTATETPLLPTVAQPSYSFTTTIPPIPTAACSYQAHPDDLFIEF